MAASDFPTTGGMGLSSTGSASLGDILTALKDEVVALNNQIKVAQGAFPTNTSSQITASTAGTLVQSGFVRLTGVSIVTATTMGGLYDAPTVAAASAGQQVGVLLTTPGFYAMNMVFALGLVAKPSTGQVVSLHYARV